MKISYNKLWHILIDKNMNGKVGKAISRTGKEGQAHSALQILTAYLTESGVCIRSKVYSRKDK